MKRDRKFIYMVLTIVFLIFVASCASAPKGYENKDRYLYIKGDNSEAAIIFTADLFRKLYNLPTGVNCLLEFSVTQLDHQYSGWNGVKFLEIQPGYHNAYIGMVGYGAPNSSLEVEKNRVYVLTCKGYTIYQLELDGAIYSPQRKIFIYQGKEYGVP